MRRHWLDGIPLDRRQGILDRYNGILESRTRSQEKRKQLGPSPGKWPILSEAQKQRVRERIRERIRERRKTDAHFRVKANLSSRLSHLLQGHGGKQGRKTLDFIGCSRFELMRHLERQFKPGMAWNNYGSEWHVDHERPCYTFDFSQHGDARICFHFSNLRPLWATENLRRGKDWPILKPEKLLYMRTTRD